jgi:hypothetical protein
MRPTRSAHVTPNPPPLPKSPLQQGTRISLFNTAFTTHTNTNGADTTTNVIITEHQFHRNTEDNPEPTTHPHTTTHI